MVDLTMKPVSYASATSSDTRKAQVNSRPFIGHSSYVTAMIEIDAHKMMIDTLVAVVPKLNDIGYTRVAICIEYEWKTHRCGTSAVFGHTLDTCTNSQKEALRKDVDTFIDGFEGSSSNKHGNKVSKNQNDDGTSGSYKNPNVVNNNGKTTILTNPFDVLNMVVNEKDVTLSTILGATISKDYSKPRNNKASDLGVEESGSEVEEFVRIYAVLTVMDLCEIRNLFPPLDNPELTIQRRSRSDPTLLNNSEMAAEGPGDLSVLDLRSMEELCQPSLNGRGGPIALISIQATNFGLKNDMIHQVQNSCQFPGLSGSKAVTQNCETCCGPHSFSDCPATVGNTQNVYAAGAYQGRNQFFQGANQGQKQAPGYQAPAYQAPVYQAPVHQPQIPQPQVVTTNEFRNFMKANDSILKNMQTNMTPLTNSNLELKNMFGQFMKMNTASYLGSGTLLGNTITNPKEDLKGITTRRGNVYPGPMIPTTSSSPVVERETEATKDTVHPTNNESTKDIQPLVVQSKSPTLNSEPVKSPIIEPVASLVSALRPNQRP
uniref:Reverse transcriptase domain-containing protein n=1 Tax=Tanacetum cinerariifolium TaxID=118510 RepID=A0A6L2N6A0_TANCI|nr:reverse transcriptase domain-containing protein [Tanacetum cinerariifolium]